MQMTYDPKTVFAETDRECTAVQSTSGFVFHHANAFETQGGCVVVDAVRYPTLPDSEQACGSGRNFVQVTPYVLYLCLHLPIKKAKVVIVARSCEQLL